MVANIIDWSGIKAFNTIFDNNMRTWCIRTGTNSRRHKIRHSFSSDRRKRRTSAPNGNIRLDGKAIIAAKHMSILEIAILSTRVPNYFFIIKRELLWIPIYGWAFWRMGLQGVNRARGATNMHKLTSAVAKKLWTEWF